MSAQGCRRALAGCLLLGVVALTYVAGCALGAVIGERYQARLP